MVEPPGFEPGLYPCEGYVLPVILWPRNPEEIPPTSGLDFRTLRYEIFQFIYTLLLRVAYLST